MTSRIVSGRVVALATMLALVSAAPMAAQPPSPGARTGALMVYDAAHRQVLLFGGTADARSAEATEYPNDLWAWDGSAWRVLPVAPGSDRPSGRDVPQLAYDAARQRVVMVGGRRERPGGSVEILSDVWEWDGTRWHRVRSAGLPKVIHAATAYDPVRRRVVMFGGIGDAGLSHTLSEWDGATWTIRDTTGTGSLAAGAAVTRSGELIVLTMQSSRAEDSVASRTWMWNGAAWRQGELGPAVTSLQATASAPDGTLYLYQSWGPGWLATANTYTRSPEGAWTRIATSTNPGVRSTEAAAYDAGRNRLVLYGGSVRGQPLLSDTWEFDGAEWVRKQPR